MSLQLVTAPLISVQASTGGLWSAARVQVMKQCSVFMEELLAISQQMMCDGFEELYHLEILTTSAWNSVLRDEGALEHLRQGKNLEMVLSHGLILK